MTNATSPQKHDPGAALGPATVLLYVCRECSVWTLHRRKRCAWCPCKLAPEIVQYTREGSG